MDQRNRDAMLSGPHRQPLSPTLGSGGAAVPAKDEEIARLRARVAELQHERDHLVALVDILQAISASLHFVDILREVVRKLGDAFGLDRCAIFLSGEANEVRLVASYEDPTVTNLVVDLKEYPELNRPFKSGETVFIPDAATDPTLRSMKGEHDMRNVRSIVVVPIQWHGTVIGAISLRTNRYAKPFSDTDVRFFHAVASVTAKALRNAHRVEAMLRTRKDGTDAQHQPDLRGIALIAFVRRLLDRYTRSDDNSWGGGEELLPRASQEELERLVTVAVQVIGEEAKG
jgi:GAF domain-containing protein